nr:hypothetical protein [Mesorhizobium sp. L2C066B000]
MVVLAGDITSDAQIAYSQFARDTTVNIGYDNDDIGFDGGLAPSFWTERQYKWSVFSAVSRKLWSCFGFARKVLEERSIL